MIAFGVWHRLSLRGRLMVVGTGGIVAGLAVGSLVLIAVMNSTLQRTIDRDADTTVAGIAAMIEQDGQVAQPLPVPAGQVAQVLSHDGRQVLAASSNADFIIPLLLDSELKRALDGARVEVPGDRALQDDPLRAKAVRVANRIVVVAVPVGAFNRSVDLLRTALIITEPLLVLVLVLVGWRVIGASLRPVEVLRSGAERITGAATEERLPVPPAKDEIQRLAVTLNDMLDRLAGARARQRAFVADAAHELRSPLANIRVQLEVAQRLGDWTSVGDDILIDVERLTRLVDDLLLLARADERPRPLRAEPVDVDALLETVCGRYAGVRVMSRTGLFVLGEPDAVLRMLVNLVDNAVRHTRSDVRLDAVREGDQVLITVTDDGLGILESDRKRVFDRFTRLDDARARDAGGAGLGLAIVRELARRHGGSVLLADAEPGVRAELRLPVTADLDVELDATGSLPGGASG